MARVANVNIPDKKAVLISLTYIHGIGRTTAEHICHNLSIPMTTKVEQLTTEQLIAIRELIKNEHEVEGDLRRKVAMSIKRKIDINCYQGIRHRRHLPVRGQNTHSNARTRKGRSNPIANKKKATK